MQPYFFPYPKYYELASKVDIWVFLDNVNFQKRGFIHRNFINKGASTQQINLRLRKSSQNKRINEIVILDKHIDTLSKIQNYYHNASCYQPCYDLMLKLLSNKADLLSDYLINLNIAVFEALNIQPLVLVASRDFQQITSSGENRILDIVTATNASKYINLPGGKGMYNRENFLGRSCELEFLDEHPIIYQRDENPFVDKLSIIDFLMFNYPTNLFCTSKV